MTPRLRTIEMGNRPRSTSNMLLEDTCGRVFPRLLKKEYRLGYQRGDTGLDYSRVLLLYSFKYAENAA
jgi:hypothetical protein